MQRGILFVGVATVSLAACGQTRLDAGSNRDRDSGADASAEAEGIYYAGTPSNTLNLPCALPAPDFLAGTWVGQFDTFTLPSTARSIRIEFKGSYLTTRGLCGTVVFGEGDPLPLPTNARDYPPAIPREVSDTDFRNQLLEGFPFEFYMEDFPSRYGLDGSTGAIRPVEGNRVRFSINAFQIYNAWCNMQGAFYVPASSGFPRAPFPQYQCIPESALVTGPGGESCDGAGLPAGVTVRGFSCAQVTLCSLSLCDCGSPNAHLFMGKDSIGCQAGMNPVLLDFRVTNGEMIGAVSLPIEGLELAHLTRSAEQ